MSVFEGPLQAQVTGLHWEIDRVFYPEDTIGDASFVPLLGSISYILYADVTNESDWIASINAVNTDPNSPPLSMSSTEA
ncbi:MAG: hypothetical protein L7S02_06755, partial [Flavobacteriales bacterium]|nr:hypothetical protein [Flavobacteriales bacterium]